MLRRRGAELARAECPSQLRWPAGLFFSQIDEGRPLRGVVYDVFLTESGIIFLLESTNHGVQSISSHCGDGVYGHSATAEAQNLRGGGGWVQSLEFWRTRTSYSY